MFFCFRFFYRRHAHAYDQRRKVKREIRRRRNTVVLGGVGGFRQHSLYVKCSETV